MSQAKIFKALLKADVRFSVLILATIFTLPLGWQAITNTLLLIVLVHSLLFLRPKDWVIGLKSHLFLFSAAFVAFYVLSLLWSENINEGLLQLETKLTFFFGPLLIVAAKNRYVGNMKISAQKALFYGCVFVSVAALIVAAQRSFDAGRLYALNSVGEAGVSFFAYTELSKAFMHPGYLATYLGIGIFIGINFFLQEKSKKRWRYFALALFLFAMMILLQGRINLLALFAIFGIVAIYVAVQKKAYNILLLPLIPVLLLAGVMAFGSESLKKRYFQMPDFSYDISGDEFNSATYRLAEWKCAADVIEKHLWVGTGMGDNREALIESYENNKFWKGVEREFNAHNQYLETTVATGVLGLFLLLLMLIYYGVFAYNQNDKLTAVLILFFAFCMLTESMFERAWAVLLFTSYFPLVLSLGGIKSKA